MAKPFRTLRKVVRRKVPKRLPVSAPEAFENADGQVVQELLELAPPQPLPTDVFRPACELDRVALGLALAFNDLRDSIAVSHLVERGRPATARLDGYDAAVAGLEGWGQRITIGVLNEALAAVERHRVLLTGPDTSAIFSRRNLPHEAWDRVVKLASATVAESGDRRYLKQIRNKLAYHYGDPAALAEAYRSCFLEPGSEKTAHTEHLWVSEGSSLKQIRYYFVDAAVGVASARFDSATAPVDRPESDDRLLTLTMTVAAGLHQFIHAFIQHRLDAIRDPGDLSERGS